MHAHNSAPEEPAGQPLPIPADAVGQRLDRYLTTLLPQLSRSAVQQLIAEGAVLVNGKPGKAGAALRAHDEVRILRETLTPAHTTLEPRALPLEIVYEDDDLLVINKPAGLVVHPAPGHRGDTLVNALLARYPQFQEMNGPELEESDEEDEPDPTAAVRPGIVHRLDKDTSGLLLVAKNARTQAALVEQMKQHQITKRYLALVQGLVKLDQGTIDAPIGRDPRHRQQMAITSIASRAARTHFRVLERFTRHTLLLIQLETGRTHQIRVHLQAIGHPVVGDPVYGPKQGTLPLKRQFLHAYQVQLTHPITGAPLEFEAPLPADLQKILDQKSVL